MFPAQLKTKRLLLRRCQPDDARAIAQILSNPAVQQQLLMVPENYRLQDAHEWIQHAEKAYSNQTELIFSVISKEQNELIGNAGIHLNASKTEAEIGYWLAESCWGKGYATELARALVNCALTLPNITKLFATTAVNNTGSQRVLEKIGFKYSHEAKRKAVSGKARLSNYYVYPLP
jgi:[ribosomal protein S5]-alanine N-acetyltransferase